MVEKWIFFVASVLSSWLHGYLILSLILIILIQILLVISQLRVFHILVVLICVFLIVFHVVIVRLSILISLLVLICTDIPHVFLITNLSLQIQAWQSLLILALTILYLPESADMTDLASRNIL